MHVIFAAVPVFFSIVGTRASISAEVSSPGATHIGLNSVGCFPQAAKVATVAGGGKGIVVRDPKASAVVIRGRLTRVESDSSHELLQLADFSVLKPKDAYEIEILDGPGLSVRFQVNDDNYNWPLYCCFRAMYLRRYGTEASVEFEARHHQHSVCPLDDAYLKYIVGSYLICGAWPKESSRSDDFEDNRTDVIATNWNGALIYSSAAFVQPHSFDVSIKSTRKGTGTTGASK